MSNYSSSGEVYGSKVLTLAIIAASAFILAGTVYSPSQPSAQTGAAQTQQIVDTAHSKANGVSG